MPLMEAQGHAVRKLALQSGKSPLQRQLHFLPQSVAQPASKGMDARKRDHITFNLTVDHVVVKEKVLPLRIRISFPRIPRNRDRDPET